MIYNIVFSKLELISLCLLKLIFSGFLSFIIRNAVQDLKSGSPGKGPKSKSQNNARVKIFDSRNLFRGRGEVRGKVGVFQ